MPAWLDVKSSMFQTAWNWQEFGVEFQNIIIACYEGNYHIDFLKSNSTMYLMQAIGLGVKYLGKVNTIIFLLWPTYISVGTGETLAHIMNSMKLVIPLQSLYWSIHTKDESKRGTAFAFIFGVNWLWRCGVTASFGVFFHEIKCNGMTSFM